MIAIIGLAVTGLAFLALFLFGRRAGKDAVKAKVAEKTIEQIVDAVRPPTDVELDRVRSKYRRD
jgi:uncharacterized membrane protein YdjX (TVP38/TMEM64 family)